MKVGLVLKNSGNIQSNDQKDFVFQIEDKIPVIGLELGQNLEG